ncbi:hypothetical protein HBH1_02947 [Herbaspirillum sp. BH-1]|uniref:Membrane protein n=1 Tax=Herbaspirillum frisingense TaxID=92645 RepID=A0ABU1PD70_9BURK|nr:MULTISPECIES: DUF2069 domain-containing protein [Herbaspirillum]MDR6583739.1 putative membrane protein [Herbaspirillum frisingense]PLY58750.1 hypothetical protein HBH1_02947 [Herbaspirillum sp. BH-1]QNB08477.1 DUF2069 domain-containing protein [Herbaspirillum frisingense]
MNSSARYFHLGASSSLVVLILLCVAWELALAPLRPGGSWMVLKVVPLLLPLRGILKRDVYTLQWSSMLILVYLAEGLVRATSDANHTSVWLAWGEVALTTIYFICALAYLHPFKKAAKEIARQAIHKASR